MLGARHEERVWWTGAVLVQKIDHFPVDHLRQRLLAARKQASDTVLSAPSNILGRPYEFLNRTVKAAAERSQRRRLFGNV